jgi:hypothetical protein
MKKFYNIIKRSKKNTFISRPLENIKKPTPSDIDISQSINPILINDFIKKIGVNEDEFEQYGKHIGKVDSCKNLFFKLKDKSKNLE